MTNPRDHGPGVVPKGPWRAIPASRLRPVGPAGSDAQTWFARGAVLLLVAGAAWCLWSTLRPLPLPEEGASATIPAVPSLPGSGPELASRQQTLASLNRENLFSVERRPWARQTVADAAKDPSKPAEPGAPSAAGAPKAQPQVVNGQTIGLTPVTGLPEDLKKALAAVELKGVFIEPGGAPVAMIGFVHTSNRFASTPYRAGEEFKDEQNPQQPWKVLAVDYKEGRAILSRAGHNVELTLYRTGPVAKASSSGLAPAAKSGGPVTVVTLSPEEVAEQLRAAKIPEAQIQAMIARMKPPESDAALALEAELARRAATEAKATESAAAPERAPPAGMESVLQMMKEQAKTPAPAADQGGGQPSAPQQDKPRRGRRRGDPGPAPSQQAPGTGGSPAPSG